MPVYLSDRPAREPVRRKILDKQKKSGNAVNGRAIIIYLCLSLEAEIHSRQHMNLKLKIEKQEYRLTKFIENKYQ